MNIIVAGDYSPQNRLKLAIESLQYIEVFTKDIVELIKTADYSIVNFESPIIDNSYRPIAKCGPNLYSTSNSINAIKYAGFSAVTLANNHILDYGKEGLAKTVDCCKEQGIDVVGVGKNIDDAARILYVERCGQTLAIINCCEHEFSYASDSCAGANPVNPVKQWRSILEAREKSDYVLLIVHGGHEHFQLPSPRMKETYRFFIDAGADAVVNHHQHCYSGYEVYNGKPIFYGIGNFCFDMLHRGLKSTWNYGYLVQLTFHDKTISFHIHPYKQCAEKASVELLPQNAFDAEIKKLNSIILDDELLQNAVSEYYHSCIGEVASIIEPIQNRYLSAAQRYHLLPSLISRKWILKLQNYVLCESHRDKITYYFNNK